MCVCVLQHLEENTELSNSQRKQLLEDRKRELQGQLKASEEEHMQILKTIVQHDNVDFKQVLLQQRHSIEKALLQEVRVGRCEGVRGWRCESFPPLPRS